MKKILALSSAFLLTHLVYGQTEKGSFLIGGGIGLGSSQPKTTYSSNFAGPPTEYKTLSLGLNPNALYFVANGLAAGVSPSYSFAKETQTDGTLIYKTNSFSVGPAIRYYYMLNRWSIFSHVSYNFGWQTTHNVILSSNASPVDITVKSKLSTFKAGVGSTFFINNKVGVEGLLFYQQNVANYDNYSISKTSFPSINFNIGLQVYLNKKPTN